MTRDDIVKWSAEAGIMPPNWGATENQWRSLEAFAALVVAAERKRKAWDAEHWMAYEHDVAAAEREACASLEIEVVVPTKDYSSMTPLDCYEAALMDQAIAFRKAIRARGQQ